MNQNGKAQKLLGIIIPIILFVLVLVNCREKGLIDGKPGQILTDGKIRFKVITVYQKGSTLNFYDAEKTLSGLIVIIENAVKKDIQVKWISGAYSGTDVNDNYWWAPVLPSDAEWPKALSTEGIVGMPMTTETILSKEKKLKFTPITLKPTENCKAFMGGVSGTPEEVRLKVRLGDNTESGPFLIEIPEKKE